jgi:hypothetical protein
MSAALMVLYLLFLNYTHTTSKASSVQLKHDCSHVFHTLNILAHTRSLVLYTSYCCHCLRRVSEAEMRIIEMVPRPPSSILLLGRSGTGKTTVLVFR